MKITCVYCGLLALSVVLSGQSARAQPTVPQERWPAGLPAEVRAKLTGLYSREATQRATAAARLAADGRWAAQIAPVLAAMLGDRTPLYDENELARRSMISSFASPFSYPNTPGEVAARTLAKWGQQTEEPVVEAVLPLLEDNRARANALRVLGEMHSLQDPAVLKPLLRTLHDPQFIVQENTVIALGTLSKLPRQEAVPPLLEMLARADKHSKLRPQIVSALGSIGDRRAFDPLLAGLADNDVEMRKRCAGALASLGDQRALAPLVALLDDADRQVRDVTAGALGRLGNRGAVKPLLASLRDGYINVRARAAQSLGELGDPSAVPLLIRALKEEDEYVRWHAAVGLGMLKDGRAREALTEALKDPSEIVRLRARDALKEIDRAARMKLS
jgi:HEAT repeat protein